MPSFPDTGESIPASSPGSNISFNQLRDSWFNNDNNFSGLSDPGDGTNISLGVSGNQNPRVNQEVLLSELIETAISDEKPIIVTNDDKREIGVITHTDLLKAVVQENDDAEN